MGEKVEKVSGSFLSGFVVTGTAVLPRLTRRIDSLNTPAFTASGALTTAQIVRGNIFYDTNAGDVNVALPSAASLINGIANVYILANDGDSIEFLLNNDGANVLTLVAGANGTVQGDTVIPSGKSRTVTVIRNSPTTVAVSASNPFAAPGSVPVQATDITAASNETYTAAQLLGGYITRNPNGATRTDVTATGTQIDTERPVFTVGSYFDVTIKNTAIAAEDVNVTGGAGVTVIAAITIAQNETAVLRFIKTNTANYDVVQLG